MSYDNFPIDKTRPPGKPYIAIFAPFYLFVPFNLLCNQVNGKHSEGSTSYHQLTDCTNLHYMDVTLWGFWVTHTREEAATMKSSRPKYALNKQRGKKKKECAKGVNETGTITTFRHKYSWMQTSVQCCTIAFFWAYIHAGPSARIKKKKSSRVSICGQWVFQLKRGKEVGVDNCRPGK